MLRIYSQEKLRLELSLNFVLVLLKFLKFTSDNEFIVSLAMCVVGYLCCPHSL